MELTKKQAIYLLTICLVANKVQRLPSLISSFVGRHGWLAFLIMGSLDILFLFFALSFNKKAKKRTTYQICEQAGGGLYAKLIFLVMAIYFLINSLLPYEAVHDLFANILFDKLSWSIYGIILALSVFFVASRGLKSLGRISELFFYIIVVSFLILLILGATTTNYYHVLPIKEIDAPVFIKTCLEYNLWFGDFILIYIFVGKIKTDKKPLGFKCVLAFSLAVLLISFSYVVYYGLYENLSINQNSLISSISQFSLLELDIGRIDWFFVLFFQISTVISSSTYIFASAYCVGKIIANKNNKIVCFVMAFVVYMLDIFIFKSVQAGAGVIAGVSKYFALFMIILFPIIMQITLYVANVKGNKKTKQLKGLKGFTWRNNLTNPLNNKTKGIKRWARFIDLWKNTRGFLFLLHVLCLFLKASTIKQN